jgi:hypothetical protein
VELCTVAKSFLFFVANSNDFLEKMPKLELNNILKSPDFYTWFK